MSERNEFDELLSNAMRRVNAPETLEKFLMAAAEMEKQKNLPRRERKHKWALSISREWFSAAAFATAALLLIGVVGGERVHERHVREAAATQQFETATRITDQALEHTRQQLAKAGISLEQ